MTLGFNPALFLTLLTKIAQENMFTISTHIRNVSILLKYIDIMALHLEPIDILSTHVEIMQEFKDGVAAR